jgi:hypothetical protein
MEPLPTPEDPEVKKKRDDTKKAARNRMGYGKTNLTQAVGAPIGDADTARKTLG